MNDAEIVWEYGTDLIGNVPMRRSENGPWEPVQPTGEARDAVLWYPRKQGEAKTVRAHLHDLFAAPDLVLSYDFERDGWLIWPEGRPLENVFIESWPPIPAQPEKEAEE